MSQRAVSVPQEELDRLSGNRNVLAALLEAALGAVFLEYGFEQIEDSVVGAFAGRIEYARTTYVDHKTELQEALARLGRSVTYTVVDVAGPAARPHLHVRGPMIDGEQAGSGSVPRRRPPSRKRPARRSRASGSDSHMTSLEYSPFQTSCRVHLRAIKLRGFKSFPSRSRFASSRGRRRRRAERLREVEHLRCAPLGRGQPRAERAARREAGRRPLRGRQGPGGPADYCEVELLFDNEDGALAELPFAEVSFMRRLHRGGEGQYLVNRPPVRRTDLVELLADVGLGGSMGSIISQGRVEEILGSKPEERRQLVEEAAGLGRFKRRRHRAELKLARVAVDVERARDLETEVKKRLRPLALQATAAERAEKLRGEIGAVRARIAQLELAVVEERRTSAEERREAATLARNRTAKELEALLGERDRVEGELVGAAGGREEATASGTGSRARPSGSSTGARARRPWLEGSVPTRSAASRGPRRAGAPARRGPARARPSRSTRTRTRRARGPAAGSAGAFGAWREARPLVARRRSGRRAGRRRCAGLARRGGGRGRRAEGARLSRAGARGRAREPRRGDRRREAGRRRSSRRSELLRATELSVTREGFAFDPARGELWYAGEAAEAVLLELEARRALAGGGDRGRWTLAPSARRRVPASDLAPAELAERLTAVAASSVRLAARFEPSLDARADARGQRRSGARRRVARARRAGGGAEARRVRGRRTLLGDRRRARRRSPPRRRSSSAACGSRRRAGRRRRPRLLADRLARLERRREALGSVNPLAKEEYEREKERLDELRVQRADLEASLRSSRRYGTSSRTPSSAASRRRSTPSATTSRKSPRRSSPAARDACG